MFFIGKSYMFFIIGNSIGTDNTGADSIGSVLIVLDMMKELMLIQSTFYFSYGAYSIDISYM